jgi:hypothetical protein
LPSRPVKGLARDAQNFGRQIVHATALGMTIVGFNQVVPLVAGCGWRHVAC